MTARRVGAAALTALLAGCGALLAGCGAGNATPRSPSLSALPMVPGASIAAQVKECDRGADTFCALELVIVNRRYRTSRDLVIDEHRLLKKMGWSSASADTGEQRAADSPGHKFRVTYATAYGDLKGIDLGWIKRPRPIALALSRALFERAAAMSVMLEIGNA
jgi:hypothetical protein